MAERWEFKVDRLLPTDQVGSMRDLLMSAIGESFSPDCGEWLERLVGQVSRGDKLAFGAFRYTMARPDDLELVGLVVVEQTLVGVDQDPTLRLELLFVAPEWRNPMKPGARAPRVGTSLLERVERFANKHGYRRLAVEAPVADSSGLYFFLSSGFVLSGSDHTLGTEPSYRFTYELPPNYTGDSHDPEAVVEWLTGEWGFDPDGPWGAGGRDFRLGLGSGPQALGPGLPLRAQCWPIPAPSDEPLETERMTIHFVLDGETRPEPVQPEAPAVSLGELRAMCGRETLSFEIPEEPALVVSIRSEFLDRLAEAPERTTHAFVDGGQYGQMLNRVIMRDGHVALAFIDADGDPKNPELIGVASARSVDVASPAEIWDRFGNLTAFSSRDEYMMYAVAKSRMTCIQFDSLKQYRAAAPTLRFSDDHWSYVEAAHVYEITRMLD
jgi:hypothetical protein